MTDDNILKEEVNTSDDEFKRESPDSIISGDNSSDENLNEEEELDFYDFLEVISDKIDNITTQSKQQKK
jgi:hypothetical protein